MSISPVNIILTSSTTGLDIDTWINTLCDQSHSKQNVLSQGHDAEYTPYSVESILVQECESRDVYDIPVRGRYDLNDSLTLPEDDLIHAANRSIKRIIDNICQDYQNISPHNNTLAFITFHPVLFHLLTNSFITPYSGQEISEYISQKDNATLKTVLSIHDDIHDVHTNLLDDGKLFDPSTERKNEDSTVSRNPAQDIHEQLFLLEWRSRELSEAKSMSSDLDVNHFLFHKKGHLPGLWKILTSENSECNIYFSHPISQPRRDITNDDSSPERCETPDFNRGKNLINECQGFADKLKFVCPVIEPTKIDERRIDFTYVKSGDTKDLSECTLPPLTPRWPTSNGLDVDNHENITRFTKTNSFLDSNTINNECDISELLPALKLLDQEFDRQISSRDHTLTEQASLLVAYRPFVAPDSPDPSGGMRREIEIVERKIKRGKQSTKPAVVIIHPLDDEVERRKKSFDKAWEEVISDRFFPHENGERISNFKVAVRQCISNADYSPDFDRLNHELMGCLTREGIVPDISVSGGVTKASYGQADEARKEFVDYIINRTVLIRSSFQQKAEDGDLSEYFVIINNNRTQNEEAIRRIRELLVCCE